MTIFFRSLYLVLFLSSSLVAQPSYFDQLYASGDTLKVTLDTDFRQLIRGKKTKEYQTAEVRIEAAGLNHTFAAKVRTRGNVRLEVCQLPSLKLKLPKRELLAAGFSDLNEWKFVLPCSKSTTANLYLRRERLAYLIYGELDAHHLRTIPIRLYLPDREFDAFLVEHGEQLAARFSGREYPSDKLSSRSLVREPYVRLCLFNYMICNTDFNFFNLHNLAILSSDTSKYFLAFPYDFDYSGLVGTNYSVPHESLNLKSVYQRKWRGRHVTEAELRTAIAYFQTKKEAVLSVIRETYQDAPREAIRATNMIEDFYRLVSDPKKVARIID